MPSFLRLAGLPPFFIALCAFVATVVRRRPRGVLLTTWLLATWLPFVGHAAEWAYPPRDVSAAGQTADSPQVAVNARGDAFAAWSVEDASGYRRIQASRFANGYWTAPTTLSIPNMNAHNPKVAVGDDGTAVLIWHLWKGDPLYWPEAGRGDIVIEASRYSGGVWSQPVELGKTGYYEYEFMSLMMYPSETKVVADGYGNAHVAWTYEELHGDRSHHSVLAASFSGDAWSAPVELDSVESYSASINNMVADGKGNAFAIWSSPTGTKSARFSNGAWSSPVTLTSSDRYGMVPMAVDAAGTVYAGWQEETSFRLMTYSGGAWRELSRSPWNPDSNAFALAADTGGAVYVVWARYNFRPQGVVLKAARYKDGAWSLPRLLAGKDYWPVGYLLPDSPQVVVDHEGNTMAIWSRYGDDNRTKEVEVVHGKSREWNPPIVLADSAHTPSLGLDRHGNAIAMWESNGTVQAIRYVSTALPTIPLWPEGSGVLLAGLLMLATAWRLDHRRRGIPLGDVNEETTNQP